MELHWQIEGRVPAHQPTTRIPVIDLYSEIIKRGSFNPARHLEFHIKSFCIIQWQSYNRPRLRYLEAHALALVVRNDQPQYLDARARRP